jgi:hypothetical protein
MPLWSLEEMKKFNQALPSTSLFHIQDLPSASSASAGVGSGPPAASHRRSELESRFFKWGGCVRSVFDPSDTWRIQALRSLSELADLNALNAALGKVRVNPKAFGRLIHLEIDPVTFHPIKSIIGSEIIAEEIAQQMCSQKVEDVAAFLRDSRGYGSLAPLAGNLFEAVAHLTLKKGGKFTITPLGGVGSSGLAAAVTSPRTVRCCSKSAPPPSRLDSTGRRDRQRPRSSPSFVEFPCKIPEVIFSDIDDLDSGVNVYARPVQKNFPSIDSLLIRDGTISLFSITTAENHDLKDKGLALVHSHFNASSYNLYIVVPDFRLAHWRTHSPLSHGVNCNLSQFLLSIDLSRLGALVHDAPILDLNPQAKKQKLQASAIVCPSKTVHCKCSKDEGRCQSCKCKRSKENCDTDCGCSSDLCQNR